MNPHCKAFTFDDEEELAIKFSLIPEDVDILVTHSPPWETLDKNVKGHPCGSMELESYLDYFPKLKLHVFGHIHEAYGTHFHLRESWEPNDIHFVNASHVNERYQPVNKPIRVIL
jgi:Icc-related predicted phosphoesterase